MIACVSGGWRGDRASVNPSSDQEKGEHLLACLGLPSMPGEIYSFHLVPRERESYHGSRHAAPNSSGVCGGIACSTFDYDATIDATNTAKCWIAWIVATNAWIY